MLYFFPPLLYISSHHHTGDVYSIYNARMKQNNNHIMSMFNTMYKLNAMIRLLLLYCKNRILYRIISLFMLYCFNCFCYTKIVISIILFIYFYYSSSSSSVLFPSRTFRSLKDFCDGRYIHSIIHSFNSFNKGGLGVSINGSHRYHIITVLCNVSSLFSVLYHHMHIKNTSLGNVDATNLS